MPPDGFINAAEAAEPDQSTTSTVTPTAAAAPDPYNIQAALKAGYNVTEIADYLGRNGVNVAGARKAGYLDDEIVSHLIGKAPEPEPAPEPKPEEPVSSTWHGITNAVGQDVIGLGGKALEFGGDIDKGLGAAAQAGARNAADVPRLQLDIIDKIDSGEPFKAQPADLGSRTQMLNGFGLAYAASDAQTRARIRDKITAQAAVKPEDTLLSKAGSGLTALGDAIHGGGEAVTEFGERQFPLTDEEERRWTVRGTHLATGLAPYVLAGVAGGLPALAAVAGFQGFGSAFEEAKKAGQDDGEAAIAGVLGGAVDAGLVAVPLHVGMNVLAKVPSQLLKGEFVKTVIDMAKASGTGVTFAQMQTVADNLVAKQTYDPDRPVTQNVGKDIGLQAAVFALLPFAPYGAKVAGRATRGLLNRVLPEGPTIQPRPPGDAPPEPPPQAGLGAPPEPPPASPADVMAAPDLDSAIKTAEAAATAPVADAAYDEPTTPAPAATSTALTVTPTPIDTRAEIDRLAAGTGDEQQQAALIKLFSRIPGTVEQTEDGGYQFRTKGADGNEVTHPIAVWNPDTEPQAESLNPNPPPGTRTPISSATANALKEHYAQAGVDVIFYKDHAAIPFDGAADPNQPNTIFLSNNPERAVAQVAGHEFTHILASTTLPDGTSLGALLNQQIAEGITPAGRRHAESMFGGTAPKRANFPDDQSWVKAVEAHLYNELGADIGGEAPKFQSFMPRVIDAIQARYGDSVAANLLSRLLDGLRRTMQTIRELFTEGGPRSRNWISNLEDVHDTLAKMYAERFGSQAEREQAAHEAAQDRAARDALVTQPEARPAPERPAGPATFEQGDRVVTPSGPGSVYGTTNITIGGQSKTTHQVRLDSGERGEFAPTELKAEPAARPINEQTDTGAADFLDQGRQAIQRRMDALDAQMQNASPQEHRVLDEEHQRLGQQLESLTTTIEHLEPDQIHQVASELGFVGKAPQAPGTPASASWEEVRDALHGNARQLRRWLGELGNERDAAAAATPQARLLAQTEAAILRPVGGDETRLPEPARARLEAAREKLNEVTHPAADTPPMTTVRGELAKTSDELVQHTTKKGKVLTGTVRKDLTQEQAKKLDPFAFRKDGGFFIRQGRGDKPAIPQVSPLAASSEQPAGTQRVEPAPATPAPVESTPSPKPPPAPPAAKQEVANPDHALAERVAERIARGEPIDARTLQADAEQHYGGTLAQGAYSRDRHYDAVELGVNRYIQRHPDWFNPRLDAPRAMQVARDLATLKGNLPTQTVRAGEKDAYQQFSTPPDYAYAASWVANPQPSDHVLEPSAGVGGLIVHAMNAGVRETTANELSDKRRGMITLLNPTRVTSEDAAQLHNILPADVRPTVVVMNPPFSRAAERMGGRMVADEGAKHIEQALARLEPGGRLVAIVGDGMKPEGTGPEGGGRQGTGRAFAAWWDKIGAEYDVRANVGVDRDIYTKYGTSFPTRFLVIDKNPPSGRPMVTGQVRDAAALIEKLQDVRNERSAVEPVADQPGRAEMATGGPDVAGSDGELHRPTGGLGAGEERLGGAAAGVTEPAGTRQPGVGGGEPAGVGRPAGGEGVGVVPVQSESGRTGAGGQPGGRAGAGGQPGGRGSRGSGDGIRPDGSGERDEPGVTPAPEPVLAVENATAAPDTHAVNEAVYEPYKPQRVRIAGAKAHPGALVQSAAMASVAPPASSYQPRIPAALVKSGALSDAQLEAIVYAGHAHSDVMADGKRRGFFIGDGCVAAGTRIFNPIAGTHTPIEQLVGKPHTVLSLTSDGFAPATAVITFRKGEADLYRVVLDDGRAITVTGQHRFLTPDGWAKIDDGAVQVGVALACSEVPAAADTSWSPIRGACVPPGSRTAQDYRGDCSGRACDEPPRLAVGSDLASSPSPTDALARNHPLSRRDDPAPSPSHSGPHQSAGRHSRRNWLPSASLGRALSVSQGHAAPVLSWLATPQNAGQSPPAITRQLRTAAPVLSHQPALASGSSRTENAGARHVCEADSPIPATSCRSGQRALLNECHPDKLGSSLASDLAVSTSVSFAWRKVTAIEPIGHHAFYDMYVPGPENYVAEGIVNHNTGVGKGREIAGIILDNFQNGRKKAIWISEKRALINDAKRDWNGMNQPASDIIDHGKLKPGDPIKGDKGILFSSYDTLKSAEQTKNEAGKVRGKERVDQIIDWVGKDFDGVIAFDEAHNMGNSTDQKGGRGVKKAAAKALAAMRLQQELPNARVVYVSATGATEVSNLAYADRLGLWGEGTAFANRSDFLGSVSSGGIAGMELVARDMKALGHYIARNLSYDGVDYDRVEHTLSADQRQTYDKLAEGWQLVLRHFNAALMETGAVGENGKTQNGKAKSAAMSAFWGAHQRFFNQIITSMQMPSVIRGVEADIKAGRQAVLQLVNTMEAAQERALEKARASGEGELEDLDMTPRDQLMQMIEKSYPVQQMEDYIDDNGNKRSRPAVDSKGQPVLNRKAVAARDRLLDEIGSIRVPDGPLEMLMNHFGTDKVAEVTGRKQRVVRKPDEAGQMKTIVEPRGGQANVAEASAFQAGKKPILVFSEAGGTGRSYHAAIGTPSEGARRSHYLVQGGWRADKAVQGFGRTHRTSQASAPIFHLVTTDLQGQKRFISSIARRLAQLGALTKGERRAADQGLFSARDNLESTEARDGLTQFFKDVAMGQVEGVTMDDLEKAMGLKMRDENGALASPLPEMSTFLNRVLSLTVDHQNRVFQAFSDRMDTAIARASAAGTLDTGVETYKADKISKVSEQTVYTDPRSGAETKHVHLNAQNRNDPVSFADTLAGRNKTNGMKPDTFIQNARSGRVFAVTTAGNYTDKDGRIVPQVRLTSPIDYQFLDRDKVDRDNWKRLTVDQAKPLWDQQVAATPEFRNGSLHIITGAVLPIWDRLGGNPKIFRLQTDTGERMLGRVVPSTQVDATLRALGAEGLRVTATPGEVARQVLDGATARLANGWTIKRSFVAGEQRLEVVGPDYRHGEELTRNGVFSERIQYNTRFFIPTEPRAAAAAIEAITRTRPVTALEGGGVQFSPRVRDEEELDARRMAHSRITSQQALIDDTLKRLREPGITDEGVFKIQQRLQRARAEYATRVNEAAQLGVKPGDPFPMPDRKGDVQFSPRVRDEEEEGRAPLYSALTQAVEGVKQEKAAPGQWLATLKNMPGVKPEERAWTGLDEWLGKQPRSVTKAEVLDYLRANQLVVREVTHGGQPYRPLSNVRDLDFNAVQSVADIRNARRYAPEFDNDAGNMTDEEAYRAIVDERNWRKNPPKLTRYGSYVLPGGENYRELLLTLPPPDTEVALNDARRVQEEAINTYRRLLREANDDQGDPRVAAARQRYLDAAKVFDAARRAADKAPEPYRSSHWDEPNVVAHMRFSERTAPDGKRVLHVEEVQSDWHQEGRRKGYESERKNQLAAAEAERQAALTAYESTKEAEARTKREAIEAGAAMKRPGSSWQRSTARTDAAFDEAQNMRRRRSEFPSLEAYRAAETAAIERRDQEMDRHRAEMDAGAHPEFTAYRQAQDRYGAAYTAMRQAETRYREAVANLDMQRGQTGRGVPDAPFKTTWPMLAMKRMITWAVDHDFDRVAWTQGEAQADRYDLSKTISRIQLHDNSSGGVGRPKMDGPFSGGMLRAYDKNGRGVLNQYIRDPAELPDLIGKEAADKLMGVTPKEVSDAGVGVRERSLNGLELKIGGEGMKGFYDKQLPSEVQKLVGKFGAKVGQSEINTIAGVSEFEQESAYRDELSRGLLRAAEHFEHGTGPEWGQLNTASFRVLNHDADINAIMHSLSEPARDHFEAVTGWPNITPPHAPVPEPAPVHSVDITDKLRDAVQSQGLPLFSPKATVRNQQEAEQWTPEEARAYHNVGRIGDEKSIIQRISDAKKDIGRRLLLNLVDPYIGVKRDDPAGYVGLRNANTSTGALNTFLQQGTLRFSGSTYDFATRNGGVEHYLVRPLRGEADRFLWWVAANRAEKLTGEDRENLFSQQDIDTLKDTNQGQVAFDYTLPNGQVTRSREAVFNDSLRKLEVFNKNALDLAKRSGLISEDVVNALIANPFYVPFYRLADRDGHFAGPAVTSGFVKQYAFKTLKGGKQKLRNDLWGNAIQNWAHMIDAALRNRAAAAVLDVAVTNGAATELTQAQYDHLSRDDRADTVWIMNDGKKQYFHVDDPMLLTAITALHDVGENPVLKVAAKFRTTLTRGVAASPWFMLRNFIRDGEQAIAVSPTRLNILANIRRGFAMGDAPRALMNIARAVAARETQPLRLSDEAVSAIAGGATMSFAREFDSHAQKANVRSVMGPNQQPIATVLDTPGKIAAFWHWISSSTHAYEKAAAESENVQRRAIYHNLKAGGTPHDYASYEGRDLTDFTLRGASKLVRTLTTLVPFLNARLQGLYKVGRAAANADRNVAVAVGRRIAVGAAKRMAIVLGAMTLTQLALDWFYADDEDYKKRDEYDRSTYFWFKVGNTQFRIPMGFEIAAISRIAADGVEAFFGTNEMTGQRFLNNLYHTLGTNLSMNPTPQIAKPLADVWQNQSWSGAPIVTKGMDRLQSEYQYNASTTMPARWASSAGNWAARTVGGPSAQFLSPVQIDYLVNGYFGWLGSTVMTVADLTARGIDQAQAAVRGTKPIEPVRPNVDLWSRATGGMIATEPTRQSRYVNMLYEQGDAITKAYNTYRFEAMMGHPEEAQSVLRKNQDLIARYGQITGIERQEADLNRMIKQVGESETMTAAQKHDEILRLNAIRNAAAESIFGTRPSR